MRLRLDPAEQGLASWALRGASGTDLDGLATAASNASPPTPADHPNGVTRIDHIVVLTPGLDRTVAALEAAGLDLRRRRGADEPGPPVEMAFFRAGEVVVEVGQKPDAAGPARFWGITFRSRDLDGAARLLGERLGEPRPAVQPGRRIATVREQAGLGLPVALIDEPPG